MSLHRFKFLGSAVLSVAIAACGPSAGDRQCAGGEVDLTSDPTNCGSCGNVCSPGFSCIDTRCLEGVCQPGATEECYTGQAETIGVGPCTGGTRECVAGAWTPCNGQVVPTGENCADGVDNNCNGAVDEETDSDGDGFTTCAGDCCDSTECSAPDLVNPGAYDAAGNMFDDDCNGVVDDSVALCDQGIASNTANALDFAKAIDICQVATEMDRKWGVISGSLSLADGQGTPDPRGHAVRPRFGTGLQPQGGVSLAVLSTGAAAAKGDTNPNFAAFDGYTHSPGGESAYPADFYTANGNAIPNAPGCPAPSGASAQDPVMLTLRVRVPTNAKSFKLSTNFYSAEFPEYTCSRYNDFFVVLLDSSYNGDPANPTDKNLAFYQPAGSMVKYPVGVNLGYGNTGLFTQCLNGETGCLGNPGTINTCISTTMLMGTGFDDADPGSCDNNSVVGGATGWLVTSGNVTPGEVITLRIAIWDTSDQVLDSLAVIDGFTWSTESTEPGTVIL